MRLLITICARGGSKGIPGKNIKPLYGKPLIYYTLKIASEYARKFGDADIYLSTDSEEIKKTVKELNFPDVNLSYSRPEFLATDTAGKIEVIKDVWKFAESMAGSYDFILDLDVTSPLRSLSDLEQAFNKLQNFPDAMDIFSVNRANRNPYFNMVEERKDSPYVKLCKEGSFFTRQSAPEVYDANASFYFYRRNFFVSGFKSPMTEKTLVFVMQHLCFDLDHPIDYEFMSFLLENKKIDFEFLV